jgi:tRNA(fMet)-specific endonuclease VapC
MVYLDTNICIHYLNGTLPSVRDHLLKTPPYEIKIPVIVHSELLFGVKKSRRKNENLLKLQRFLEPFEVVNYTSEVSETYAELRLAAESTGKIVGPNDMLIAAIVVANNGTLVTRNTAEFSRINSLKLAEW